MTGKSFFVDLSRCTGCRGCQIACKQWKNKPVEPTENTGSHQNPPDLSWQTLKVLRFSEKTIDGKFQWLFFPDQCRHCLDAPCKMVGDSEVPDAIVQDPQTGAVVFTEKCKGLSAGGVREACPYDIPRVDPATKLMYKCDLCNDRIHAGLLPSCVQTCPTGTMNFGDRDEMLALAKDRLAKLKPKFPKAELVDADSVRVIFLTPFPPSAYYKYVQFGDASPRPLSRKAFLAKVMRPLRAFG
ncbi:4Fe-4S dicluster domain-containing protein [Solidesulfovibrio carbinolicus]|uniref:Formate dehydrogenase n=1 Tax=Solidesulfovibrio carbinolicus TaxID=296842 RepID=A0A4P6HJU4_9BACT|nr:4Fe-4S dicluster domain-containing protein [Solidesulfovibrio carbinolicus]QAZ67401.1 formate dehydrogenase [Solidesulfovibrio carbinolicus]HML54669.1 4Fe-4S dicluster domain-containing protein [Solidesulfovibrio magneticus]